ncbi:DUF4157 domain-containing protein [Nannocystis pusilla]|uniref:DUF4157 domain-containing protein n=1 Tax=Nannocystis pusilla TaxID=889268 RepID=A0A9X3IXL1_9BACT|nr:DUF4157 domain-containing protein [Nannocystis pusilla]MCY1008562.1 DUF4157 domain-containing protein [Nannocystis pusilla]
MSGVHRSEHAQREAPTRTTTQQHEPNARPPAALRLPELLGNQAFMRRRGVCVQRDGHGVPAPATVHRLARAGTAGPGHALPHLDVLQRSFGAHDLSGVATHTGAATRSAARGMQARAFTMGEHVGLDAGADLRTVAHEAAHVVQQRGGTGPADGVGRPGDRFERHADHVADLVVRGRSAEAALGAPTRPGAGAVALQREVDEQALIDADQPLRAPDTLTQDRECAVTGKLAANAGHNQYVSVQERLTLRRGARLRIQSENADQATIRTARWNNRAGGYDQYEGTIPTDNIRRGSTEQTPIDDPASIIPASVDDVHQEDVYQAGLSDCYFQAALLSLAHESPGAILDMLRVRDNGDIEVRLYERHWRTYEPTATWIAVKRSLFTADNGDLVYHGRRDHLLWPAFVSKAWAVHKGVGRRWRWASPARRCSP